MHAQCRCYAVRLALIQVSCHMLRLEQIIQLLRFFVATTLNNYTHSPTTNPLTKHVLHAQAMPRRTQKRIAHQRLPAARDGNTSNLLAYSLREQIRFENGRSGAAGRGRVKKLRMSMLMMLTTCLATCGCCCHSVWRAPACAHTCAIAQSHAPCGIFFNFEMELPEILCPRNNTNLFLRNRHMLKITHIVKGSSRHPKCFLSFNRKATKKEDLGCYRTQSLRL